MAKSVRKAPLGANATLDGTAMLENCGKLEAEQLLSVSGHNFTAELITELAFPSLARIPVKVTNCEPVPKV